MRWRTWQRISSNFKKVSVCRNFSKSMVQKSSLRSCCVVLGDQDGWGTNRLSKTESILGTGMSQDLYTRSKTHLILPRTHWSAQSLFGTLLCIPTFSFICIGFRNFLHNHCYIGIVVVQTICQVVVFQGKFTFLFASFSKPMKSTRIINTL